MVRKPQLSPEHDSADPDRDAATTRRLRAGDETALAYFIREYQAPLARYIDHILNSRDATEDVLQETFVQLWNHRDHLDVSKPVRHYLYRIARNKALNIISSTTARQRREQDVSRFETHDLDPADSPATTLEQREFETAVRDAIDTLPERCREIFVLVRGHQMTYAEVAALLDISVSTVKTQMGRAMTTLAVRLAPFLALTVAARASGF